MSGLRTPDVVRMAAGNKKTQNDVGADGTWQWFTITKESKWKDAAPIQTVKNF